MSITFRSGIFLGILFLLSVLMPRSLWLGTIPATIVHDEVFYVGQARSLAVSGSDLSGTWKPWYLTPAHPLYAELPGVLMAPFAMLSSQPLIAARLLYVVVGSLLPLVMGLFSWQLWRDKKITAATIILATVNPWIFQLSRLGFDALLSVFFYMIGITCLIGLKDKNKLLALLPFWIGFFNYQGHKLLFLPILGLVSLYVWWQSEGSFKTIHQPKIWQKNWPVIVVMLASVLLFGWYAWRLSSQSAGNRINDMIFFNQTYVSSIVNTERRLSLASPLSSLFSNKITVIAQELVLKYSKAFEPTLLFVRGESIRNPFSVWSMGLLYPIDAVLILIGLIAMWQNKRRYAEAALVCGLIAIAPLPSAINSLDSWIMFRSGFLFPMLVMVAAYGAGTIWQTQQKFLQAGLVLAYAAFIIWGGYQYFYRYPIYSTTGTAFAERIMADYIKRNPDKKIMVLADESEFVFTSYLVQAGQITPANMPAINQAFQTKNYTLGTVTIKTDCIDPAEIAAGTIVISGSANVFCDTVSETPTKPEKLIIPSLIDSGSIFNIYNDRLCTDHQPPAFSRITELKQLQVENLSTQEFCSSLLIKDVVPN